MEPLVHTFPNSGYLAKVIFTLGIVGLGLLAIPVLSGSAAYAVSEMFGWKEGLSLKFSRAKRFYGVIVFATVLGIVINGLRINPISALVYTAVINGLVAIPLLFLIARIGSNREIMGEFVMPLCVKILLWLTFAIMTFSAIVMFLTI